MKNVQANDTTRRTLRLPPSAQGRPITVYWVQAIGRRPPRIAHPTRDAATAEALRLSTLPANIGIKFQVRESRFVAQFCDGMETRR